MNLYRNESSDAKTNAQRNLCGRTHYVDDDTLRWHKSRVISTRCTDGGLLFTIITSDALDMNNTRRGFRYVIFDIFGNTIARPDLEHAFSTSAKAEKAMWAELNKIDAVDVTINAIADAEEYHAKEMQRMRETVDALIASNMTKRGAA
jgi:hypothetical protein